ncbi:MAG TPA: class I SAM-dependent methyltransferase [Polyangiaceae bacterium]|nr:class I SAM-dependent methyltransferase [Polyangiaceae bacterium]
MSLKDAVLGTPFVYNLVRPLVVGGIDMAPVLTPLATVPGDTVVDVGCGTGVALDHLGPFERYVGFDTDARALAAAETRESVRRRRARGERIEFRNAELGRPEIEKLAPHAVILSGLLHHLDDETCAALFRSLLASPRLRSVVTLDVTFVPGRLFNNLLTILDRGQYPRHPAAYAWLAERAGFRVVEGEIIPSRPGNDRVQYFRMKLSAGAGAPTS